MDSFVGKEKADGSWLHSNASMYHQTTRRNHEDRPMFQSRGERGRVLNELMTQLRTNQRCRSIIRMGPGAFEKLGHILHEGNSLRYAVHCSVEE